MPRGGGQVSIFRFSLESQNSIAATSCLTGVNGDLVVEIRGLCFYSVATAKLKQAN